MGYISKMKDIYKQLDWKDSPIESEEENYEAYGILQLLLIREEGKDGTEFEELYHDEENYEKCKDFKLVWREDKISFGDLFICIVIRHLKTNKHYRYMLYMDEEMVIVDSAFLGEVKPMQREILDYVDLDD